MKRLLAILILLVGFNIAVGQAPQGVTIDYDKFRDETSVSVDSLPLRIRGQDAKLSIATHVKGHNAHQTPEVAAIIFASASPQWTYLQTTNILRVLLNGRERLELGEMKRVRSTTTDDGVIEVLLIEVPYSMVLKISRASKVEMQISGSEFTLSAQQITNLRDMVAVLRP